MNAMHVIKTMNHLVDYVNRAIQETNDAASRLSWGAAWIWLQRANDAAEKLGRLADGIPTELDAKLDKLASKFEGHKVPKIAVQTAANEHWDRQVAAVLGR